MKVNSIDFKGTPHAYTGFHPGSAYCRSIFQINNSGLSESGIRCYIRPKICNDESLKNAKLLHCFTSLCIHNMCLPDVESRISMK